MKTFKEFQFGWLIVLILIPTSILIFFLYRLQIGNNPLTQSSFLLVNFTLVASLLLAYGLTTKVTTDSVKISFGIGLIRKTIKLENIKTVQRVINPWYYGWGIRFIPHGILYNISGSEGIEISFKNTDRIVRIGSSDAMLLKKEIEKRLSHS